MFSVQICLWLIAWCMEPMEMFILNTEENNLGSFESKRQVLNFLQKNPSFNGIGLGANKSRYSNGSSHVRKKQSLVPEEERKNEAAFYSFSKNNPQNDDFIANMFTSNPDIHDLFSTECITTQVCPTKCKPTSKKKCTGPTAKSTKPDSDDMLEITLNNCQEEFVETTICTTMCTEGDVCGTKKCPKGSSKKGKDKSEIQKTVVSKKADTNINISVTNTEDDEGKNDISTEKNTPKKRKKTKIKSKNKQGECTTNSETTESSVDEDNIKTDSTTQMTTECSPHKIPTRKKKKPTTTIKEIEDCDTTTESCVEDSTTQCPPSTTKHMKSTTTTTEDPCEDETIECETPDTCDDEDTETSEPTTQCTTTRRKPKPTTVKCEDESSTTTYYTTCVAITEISGDKDMDLPTTQKITLASSTTKGSKKIKPTTAEEETSTNAMNDDTDETTLFQKPSSTQHKITTTHKPTTKRIYYEKQKSSTDKCLTSESTESCYEDEPEEEPQTMTTQPQPSKKTTMRIATTKRTKPTKKTIYYEKNQSTDPCTSTSSETAEPRFEEDSEKPIKTTKCPTRKSQSTTKPHPKTEPCYEEETTITPTITKNKSTTRRLKHYESEESSDKTFTSSSSEIAEELDVPTAAPQFTTKRAKHTKTAVEEDELSTKASLRHTVNIELSIDEGFEEPATMATQYKHNIKSTIIPKVISQTKSTTVDDDEEYYDEIITTPKVIRTTTKINNIPITSIEKERLTQPTKKHKTVTSPATWEDESEMTTKPRETSKTKGKKSSFSTPRNNQEEEEEYEDEEEEIATKRVTSKERESSLKSVESSGGTTAPSAGERRGKTERVVKANSNNITIQVVFPERQNGTRAPKVKVVIRQRPLAGRVRETEQLVKTTSTTRKRAVSQLQGSFDENYEYLEDYDATTESVRNKPQGGSLVKPPLLNSPLDGKGIEVDDDYDFGGDQRLVVMNVNYSNVITPDFDENDLPELTKSIKRRMKYRQMAKSLEKEITEAEEGIRKIEQEEKLIRVGLMNLRMIKKKSGLLKKKIIRSRQKTMEKLKKMLALTDSKNQVNPRIVSKMKRVLSRVGKSNFNKSMKLS